MSKSTLQVVLLVLFIAGIVVSVMIFGGFIPIAPKGAVTATGSVTIWGTVKKNLLINDLDELNQVNKTYRIIYVEKNSQTLDQELTEALASGKGPDLFFITPDLIIRHADKVFVTPYTNFPERNFRDTFASGGELFLNQKGIVAWPFIIDPLVMYYNRDLLEGAGVAKPPEFWSDFESLAEQVTRRGQAQNIIKSTVAFGEYTNVAYAKDLLVTMIMQRGNPLVGRSETGYFGRLSDSLGESASPSESVLGFFTQFSNSTKSLYSWNKAMPYSRDAFIAGDLAIYFGYASELLNIQAKNPNLNYDVVKMPQTKEGKQKVAFGRISALAISKASKNLSTAYVAALALSGPEFAGKVAKAAGLPPARRDLLAAKPASPYYLSAFYDSALITRAWFDPSARATDAIFKSMIEDVSSGRLTVGASTRRASDQLNLLLQPR